MFVDSFEDLQSYCDNIENCQEGKSVSKHLLAFLKFNSVIYIDDLK